MFTLRRLSVAVVAAQLLTCCTGCPFRKEKIKIGADGTVLMNLEYGGSPEDLKRFDALPSERTGWKTQRTVETKTDSDGAKKETVTLRSAIAAAYVRGAPRSELAACLTAISRAGG